MFNFNKFQNETNKSSVELADLKIFSNNKIRISGEAYAKLKMTSDHTLMISRNPEDGQVAIYATKQEGLGRSLNSKREFTHQNIATILGGKNSEWAVTGEGVVNPMTNDVWFELSQTKNGADTKDDLGIEEELEDIVKDEEVEEVYSVLEAISEAQEKENFGHQN